MTPRSRKPVMLIGTMMSSSDHQTSFSSLREEDEEENTAETEEETIESNDTIKKLNTSEKRKASRSPTSPTLSNKFRYNPLSL